MTYTTSVDLAGHRLNSEGWTIIEISNGKDNRPMHQWCMHSLDPGDWTYSASFSNKPMFWFRFEKDAALFTLRWI